jgi:cytochrome c553
MSIRAENNTMKRQAVTGMAVLGAALFTGAALAQTPAGDAAAGAKKNSMCIGCHGIDGYKTAFPEVYNVPKIGGQHPAYIVKALQAYKNGERRHPSMVGIASTLSDKDMADLAAYYAAGPSKVAAK